MKFEIKGLDKLEKRLKDIQKEAAEQVNKEVNLGDLINGDFLKKNPSWNDISEFEKGLPINLEEHLSNLQFIDDPSLNKYISENSNFENWNQFINKATEEYLAKNIKF